ncbi:hypothetical protein EZI45_18905 [Delftia tsuruhatensis]|uniref:Uncharacterized protein n=1 Tax=Delftia lacustris TaxID=558537 RepID=A0A7T3DBE5_9BURK|nr:MULTISPECIES: hypothetical protein [Delftia]EPD39204.1 hypothetical protein HMPREF9701_03169 [Delftia acidovorans CCUG 274B]QPS78637.1 hypothetical protein I6G47_16525 [Delftia lacustris]TDF26191.1 hypothetical protein EZI45_18905 [Delftia tsuruhatensis]
MTNTEKQTEALRLADCLERDIRLEWMEIDHNTAAAAELRRLDAENKALRERMEAPAVDATAERDAAFEAVRKRLCGLQRYSFVLDDDGVVRRTQDRTGNWIEFDAAHELFDPVAVDAAIAAQTKEEDGQS